MAAEAVQYSVDWNDIEKRALAGETYTRIARDYNICDRDISAHMLKLGVRRNPVRPRKNKGEAATLDSQIAGAVSQVATEMAREFVEQIRAQTKDKTRQQALLQQIIWQANMALK